MSHVFLRQKLAAVAQVAFLHPLFARKLASIPQMQEQIPTQQGRYNRFLKESILRTAKAVFATFCKTNNSISAVIWPKNENFFDKKLRKPLQAVRTVFVPTPRSFRVFPSEYY